MSLEERKVIYSNSIVSINDKELRKFKEYSNYKECKDESLLLKLIKDIPLWETYLTPKQVEITKIYIGCRNASAVDIHLNLSDGQTWHTLFGKDKIESGGVLKKLKNVEKIMNSINKRK